MTEEDAIKLGEVLRDRRHQLDLSAREVARRAHLDVGTVTHLEQGLIPNPRPASLTALAGVLGLPERDLAAYTGWYATGDLPSFRPYLRSKYGDLPDEATAELESFFDYLRAKHGLDGPVDGEDEH